MPAPPWSGRDWRRSKRSTLVDANESRDWRILSDIAGVLIRRARKLYAGRSGATLIKAVDGCAQSPGPSNDVFRSEG